MIDLHHQLVKSRLPFTPDRIVGWCKGEAVASSHFVHEVRGWQRTFLELPQTKLALYFENSLEFAAALLGAWHAKKTVYLTADVIEANCQNLAREVELFIGEFPKQFRTSLRQEIESPTSEEDPFELLPKLSNDFPALVVYTSGSTGEPEAIPKKWSQLAAEIEVLERCFGATLEDACIVSTVSHHHIYGLLFKVLWPLVVGRQVYAEVLKFPEQLVQVLAQRPCALIASPAHLKRLPEHVGWSQTKPTLKLVFSSGGPLTNDALHTVQSMLSLTPFEVYGSSETGGIAWRQRDQSIDEAWQVFPGVEWRVTENAELLEIRSPYLPSNTWYPLADRVRQIDDQRFQLIGRGDRIVKIEEKRVSLDMMEKALLSDELVSEARLIMHQVEADDASMLSRRQQLCAFIVLTSEGARALEKKGKLWLNQQLKMRLSKHVEAIALPRRWRYIASMPENSQGKTTYAQLLALLES